MSKKLSKKQVSLIRDLAKSYRRMWCSVETIGLSHWIDPRDPENTGNDCPWIIKVKFRIPNELQGTQPRFTGEFLEHEIYLWDIEVPGPGPIDLAKLLGVETSKQHGMEFDADNNTYRFDPIPNHRGDAVVAAAFELFNMIIPGSYIESYATIMKDALWYTADLLREHNPELFKKG